MPFSFEAMMACLLALGVDLWGGLLLRSNNMIAAVLCLWCALLCAVVSGFYLVRWFALP